MRDLRNLLAEAARLYDEPGNGLREGSSAAARAGFAGGAEWMRRALGLVRGRVPAGKADFGRLGVGKYACAGLAALLVLGALWRLPLIALPAAIVTFYSFEARLLFVFPLALDGDGSPFIASHQLVARTLGPGVAAARVTCIAFLMLFGGLAGRGFMRSWSLGCLAVVLWYEDSRRAAEDPR